MSERTIRRRIYSTFANSVVWCCVRPGRADYQADHTFYLRQQCHVVLCQTGQSGLSGRAYIQPSPTVLSCVVSELTIRPSIHSTFANCVVWCCVRADYQTEHTFFLRYLCRLVLCHSGLSGRAYIRPSPIVSSGVVSDLAERTIRSRKYCTFDNRYV